MLFVHHQLHKGHLQDQGEPEHLLLSAVEFVLRLCGTLIVRIRHGHCLSCLGLPQRQQRTPYTFAHRASSRATVFSAHVWLMSQRFLDKQPWPDIRCLPHVFRLLGPCHRLGRLCGCAAQCERRVGPSPSLLSLSHPSFFLSLPSPRTCLSRSISHPRPRCTGTRTATHAQRSLAVSSTRCSLCLWRRTSFTRAWSASSTPRRYTRTACSRRPWWA